MYGELNNPETLQQAIRCQELHQDSPTELAAVVKLKIGLYQQP